MSVFDLDERGAHAVEEEAHLNPLDISEVDPGAWDNALQGTGKGIMRGGARVGQFIGLAASAPISLYERATDQQGRFTDPLYRALDEHVGSAVDYWTPRAHEVGVAGRILGGFGEMALPLAAGGGNPTLLIGSQTLPTGTDLVREGVDPKTATAVSLIQGGATAVGFRLPYLGKTFASRMISGTVGNLLVNTAATAAQREALQLGDYEELAAQYDPLDFEARAIDVLTGIAFGGLAHLQMRSSDRAAIAAAANAKHLQSDTAPGKPLDAAAHDTHQQAIEQAVQAVLRGEEVVPPARMAEASFEPVQRQVVEVPPELRAIDNEATKIDPFSPEAIRTAQRLQDIMEAKGYVGWGEVGGRSLVDNSMGGVQEGMSHAEQQRYLEKQQGRTPWIGHPYWKERPRGSGGEGAAELNEKQAITALDKAARGEQLKPAEKRFVDYMLERIDEDRKYQQDVPAEGRITAEDLTQSQLEEADLRLGKLAQRARQLGADADAVDAALESQSDDIAHRKLQELIEGVSREESRPNQAPAGSAGEARGSTAAQAEGGAGSSSEPGGAGKPDPVVAAAREAVAASDIRVPTGEIDAEGNPVTASAAELLARSDAEIQQAKADAVGFEAAVNCFLTKGVE